MRFRSFAVLRPIAGLVCALVFGACSSAPDLSAAASDGREVARSNGCSACHGDAGQGGVGPAWAGLYGSTVELQSGTTVTADRQYLIRSIRDPSADLVSGYTIAMPPNALNDEQIDAVVAYIEELSE